MSGRIDGFLPDEGIGCISLGLRPFVGRVAGGRRIRRVEPVETEIRLPRLISIRAEDHRPTQSALSTHLKHSQMLYFSKNACAASKNWYPRVIISATKSTSMFVST